MIIMNNVLKKTIFAIIISIIITLLFTYYWFGDFGRSLEFTLILQSLYFISTYLINWYN